MLSENLGADGYCNSAGVWSHDVVCCYYYVCVCACVCAKGLEVKPASVRSVRRVRGGQRSYLLCTR